MNYIINFIDFLNDYFLKENINMYQFSKRININDGIISRWLNEECQPTIENIIKLAEFFHCTIDYMLGLTEENNYKGNYSAQSFFENVKKLMAQKNITQYRLAKECNIGRAAVSKWFKYNQLPRLNTLVALAKYFDCSVDFFVELI